MLKEFREEHNLTQRELAEMMDISTNHVSVLEREEQRRCGEICRGEEAVRSGDRGVCQIDSKLESVGRA